MEQGWRSGESTSLPPMWPGFDFGQVPYASWVCCWISPSSEYSGFSGFPLSWKTTISKFQFDLDIKTSFGLRCFPSKYSNLKIRRQTRLTPPKQFFSYVSNQTVTKLGHRKLVLNWSTKERGSIILYGLQVKLDETNWSSLLNVLLKKNCCLVLLFL